MKTYSDIAKKLYRFLIATSAGLLVFSFSETVMGAISGICVDCHTMHNSQDNQAMNYNASATPNQFLLKGTCFGCHAMGGGSAIVTIGGNSVPQVYHTDTTDLAGGNFAYITGMKGSGASDGKGHNITDLTGADGTLTSPPGGNLSLNTKKFSCVSSSTAYGCHGYRSFSATQPGIKGAHHNNLGGSRDPADTDTEAGHSFRFLLGVKGYEDPDWQYTTGPADHNEYFAITSPIELDLDNDCFTCHPSGGGGVRPPDGTMSQFCAGCHANFHTLATSGSEGIGSGASPFLRHPTDLVLPTSGEYTAYTSYDINVPVARTAAGPWPPSGTVTPGTDAVMCLSCHVAHASDYPDMLRWDYATIITGGGGSGGCFVCHSVKN